MLTFAAKGWRGATFEQVSERAGVTRGALHHHFRDKVTLLSESLEWGWSEYGARVFTALDGDDAVAQLQSLLMRYVRLLTSDKLFRALASTTVLVASNVFTDASDKSAGQDDWHQRIVDIISSKEPDTYATSAESIAGMVLVMLQGFTVSAVTRPQDLPQPEYLEAAIAALVRGLLF